MQDLPWKLDAVQDNAYQWEVTFTQFAEDSSLSQVCLTRAMKQLPAFVLLARSRCMHLPFPLLYGGFA